MEKNLLVTFHPVTLKNTTEVHFKNLLDALSSFQKLKLFYKTKFDTYGRKIIYMIDEYVKNNLIEFFCFTWSNALFIDFKIY